MKKTNMKQKQIFIDGKPVTEDHLLKQSSLFINQKEIIDLVIDLIEEKEYQWSKGDDFAVKYFIANGGLGRINDVLICLSENIKELSNSICPDCSGEEND